MSELGEIVSHHNRAQHTTRSNIAHGKQARMHATAAQARNESGWQASKRAGKQEVKVNKQMNERHDLDTCSHSVLQFYNNV